MREFKKKRSQRQEILRFCAGAAVVLVMLLVTFSAGQAAWSMYGKFSEASASDADAQLNLAQLQQQEAQVSAKVSALQTERGQEAAIRETYGLALPGEGEIDIVQSATATAATSTLSPSWWAQLWHALFPW